MSNPKIIYTLVDEAPALATRSFLPIVKAFAAAADIDIETRDISLAGRILAQFPERLEETQRVTDDLEYLGTMVKEPDANIIKLPNISASVPQLEAAIRELQEQGFNVPDYSADPQTDEEREVRARYDRVKGSAVNPVLREGNSDRRVPASVKANVREHPHSMGAWSANSKSHVATMNAGDLRNNEVSLTVPVQEAGTARIEHVAQDGTVTVLNDRVELEAGEVIDVSFMSMRALRTFLREQVQDAKAQGVLFSVHLKATMMKVSDPILFGATVTAFFREVFEKHEDTFERLGVSANDGLGALYSKLEELPGAEREQIEADMQAALEDGPDLAMVDSDRGITNLHVPSDVIIDAAMPAAIRASGRMWGPDGELHDTKFVIPDSTYAAVYQTVIDDCKRNGAFDPQTMGSVPNVGLMARKAEEYGSHDKTFQAKAPGTIRVVSHAGNTLLERTVEEGDIWRMCQTKDNAIRDWVALAISRARATGAPAVFWLDADRPHDAELIRKVEVYLRDHDTADLDIRVMSPAEATRLSCERARQGLDTISVTGNVLRDYLTDLFPILEVGTSAKALSIVPLLNGGGLFETGAGGSAPRHVQQFVRENHLRWDSLGEFLALAASLEHLAQTQDKPQAATMAAALDRANARYLNDNRNPSRRVGETDNRDSHYYLALYWAEELADQNDDEQLAARFASLAAALQQAGDTISAELLAAQGEPVELGGYYRPDAQLVTEAMRPSTTFNRIIDGALKSA